MVYFDGDIVADHFSVAKAFNNHHSSIGETLANNIPNPEYPFNIFTLKLVSYSFYQEPTILDEVKSAINKIKISSSGHDAVNLNIMNEC